MRPLQTRGRVAVSTFSFVLGVFAGGALLTFLAKCALRSPEYAAMFVERLTKNIDLAHWISVSDSWVVARCPRCSHIERRSPAEREPPPVEEPNVSVLNLNAPISRDWTLVERVRVALAMLRLIQADIYAGRYSVIGRPNITSIQHVFAEDAETLEEHRASIEGMLAEGERGLFVPAGEQP
jgi:hypothetical protein